MLGIIKGFTYKLVFGGAIAVASFWLLRFNPFDIPFVLALPLSGAVGILIVEVIARKTGFFIL